MIAGIIAFLQNVGIAIWGGIVAMSPAAPLILAVFAGVQIWRELGAGKRRKRAVEARISGAAFLLRHQLRSWLGIHPTRERGVKDWLEMARENQSFGLELDRAQETMIGLVEIAPEAGGRISKQIAKAYVLFLAATNGLTIHDATPRPQGGGFFDWYRLLTDAEKDLEACLAVLEDGPISQNLLGDEGVRRELRDGEDPLNQILDEMEPDRITEKEGVDKLPRGEPEPPK